MQDGDPGDQRHWCAATKVTVCAQTRAQCFENETLNRLRNRCV